MDDHWIQPYSDTAPQEMLLQEAAISSFRNFIDNLFYSFFTTSSKPDGTSSL